MSLIYWLSDGVGHGVNTRSDMRTSVATLMTRWIRANGTPTLIVNGGDVYARGQDEEFGEFLTQMDGDLTLMCETPGNHDYLNPQETTQTGRIPRGYDTFWGNHPEGLQPIDRAARGGKRYEHFIDVDTWRLFFLDTGDYDVAPWPSGDTTRVEWLRSHFNPGRQNIVFAHHSRLSRGHHGHNPRLNVLWEALFDGTGPRVAFTMAGHDHNVNMYGPRSKDAPESPSVAFADGVHVFVNGAGGAGFYSLGGLLAKGKKGDLCANDNTFGVTRINLIDANSVDMDVLAFGKKGENPPARLDRSLVQIRL
jgi:hypothetical protein